jgi:tryptophanyl-tRNA synthetase
MSKEVILTGLRSNAEFHIGNYLGAIAPMVELQKKHAGEYQLNMFVPDLHSFTTPIDHGTLYQQSLDNLAVFVAAGLDIDQPDTYIYRQSYIPAHSEMTWILDCFAYHGELSRMTEFKDKSGQNENVSVGLFNYPVLMAADILLYGAKWVPVGEDQRQHVEFTRDLGMRLNNKFGELLVVPEDNAKQTQFSGRSEPVRIRSLRTPERKMSKSVQDPAGTIMLSDNPDEAAQKIMSATTDSVASINYDWQAQPGISNLLQILALTSGQNLDEVVGEWRGKSNYGELKGQVAETVKTFLVDIQQRLKQVDQAKILSKLEADESSVSEVASATLLKVQQAIGLRPISS